MTSSRRAAARTTAITVVVAVLLAETAVRVFGSNLPVDLRWPFRDIGEKFQQMSTIEAAGREFDVVFVGSSMTQIGIDPESFSEESGVTAYNAAFTNASTEALELWTLNIVEPLIHPDTVVLGLSSRELNDRGVGLRDVSRLLLESPGYRRFTAPNLALRLEATMDRISQLFRLRRSLRRPEMVAKAILGRSQSAFGALGERSLRDLPYAFPRAFAQEFETRQLNNFTMGGEMLTALEGLASSLRERGIKLVIVNMPVTRDYLTLHPNGNEDYRSYLEMLKSFCELADVPLIDAYAAISDPSLFKDPVHLGPEGQELLSASLGEMWNVVFDKPRYQVLEPARS